MSKFSWQILPRISAEVISEERSGNPARAGRRENTVGQKVQAASAREATLLERSLRGLLCFCPEVVGIMHACLPWHCIP